MRVERKVAEGERLAALGQMAATVAHEVKNPLSAIKSIAQVMSEDEDLKRQHARDLSLIVGDLSGAYNEIGIRQWFERKRAQLDGRTPLDSLKSRWNPAQPGPRRVQDLARALVASPAT